MLSCLEVTGLTKSFAGPVLRGVKLRIKAKTIHGLVGENGAGKSTFINIISGLLDPDDGSVKLNGRSFKPKSRRQSLGQGVALASQELSLIDNLSVAENIFLSALPTKKHRIDVAELQYNARELLDLVGLEESLLETPVANLSLAEKQLVELAKALSLPIERTSLLILDEPTAALNSFQAERLHKILLDRAKQGVSILYVSHRLEDVLGLREDPLVGVVHPPALDLALDLQDVLRQIELLLNVQRLLQPLDHPAQLLRPLERLNEFRVLAELEYLEVVPVRHRRLLVPLRCHRRSVPSCAAAYARWLRRPPSRHPLFEAVLVRSRFD